METINILKKYWYIPVALIVMSLIIGFFTGRATISNKKAKDTITIAESNTKLNELTNALNTKFWNQLADSSKVIQDLHEKRSADLKIKIKLESKIANDKVALARKDTTTSKKCLDALDEQEAVIFDMGLRAYNDSISLRECNFQKSVKDSIIAEKEKSFQKQLVITKTLEKALGNLSGPKLFTPFAVASYNNFNWVGAGIGVYINNIGVSAKYITDFKDKGFEISGYIKF